MRNFLLALIFVFSVNAVADDIKLWEKSTLNSVIQRGELRVATEPGYMPFEMKDKKGRIIGFDIDLAKAMAKAMGVKLKIVPTTFDGILAGLLTGKYDIVIAGMTITQKRNLKVNFSDSYLSVGQTLLAQKKYAGKHWKDLDVKENTIVTKLGQTGEIVARRLFRKAKIRTFDTEAEAVQEVMNAKATAFVYDKPYNAILVSSKGKNLVTHLDNDLSYEPLGWAIRKGDPDFINWLNNFLNQTKKDGTYDKIYNKWFKSDKWLKKVI